MSLPDDIPTQMDNNLFLIGVTAFAVGLSVVILLGPRLGRKNSSSCALAGLQNLGLTCFLNSLLQALASCPSFLVWVETQEKNGGVSESLAHSLRILSQERKEDDEEVFSPEELVFNLRGKVWPSYPQEQDPHELFLHILTAVEEEEQKATPKRGKSLLDALGDETEETFKPVASHGDVPRVKRVFSPDKEKVKLTPSSFRGYLASQLTCSTCGQKTAVVYDKFDTLSLPLPGRNDSFKLTHLLENFVSPEVIEDFACERCNKNRPSNQPQILSSASKAVKIGKLPKCLCFHISRTYMDSSGYMYKRENYIDFPEYLTMGNFTHTNSMLKEKKIKKARQSLSMSPYGQRSFCKGGQISTDVDSDPTSTKHKKISRDGSSSIEDEFLTPMSEKSDIPPPNNNNIPRTSLLLTKKLLNGPLYRLKAVVEHRGNFDTGHFVTYRRGPLRSEIRHRSRELVNQSESRWYFTSDEVVKSSSLADALSAHAYLLFYEKCETNL